MKLRFAVGLTCREKVIQKIYVDSKCAFKKQKNVCRCKTDVARRRQQLPTTTTTITTKTTTTDLTWYQGKTGK